MTHPVGPLDPSRCDLQPLDAVVGDGEVVVEIDSLARKVALEPSGYAVSIVPEHLATGDHGRVLILGSGAGPPAANGIESIAGLAFIDDGSVLSEERDDRIDVTLGVELKVVLDDLGDVVERGLLLRLAMLSARASIATDFDHSAIESRPGAL